MDVLSRVLPFLVLLVLIWFSYVGVSYVYTVYKAKQKDSSLQSCLSTTGKTVYIGATIIFIIIYVAGIAFMIYKYLDDDFTFATTILNVVTIITLLFVYSLQQIIYVGHRQMLIGKIILDYRKIKRVTFPKATKLNFVYGQKTYQTSLYLIDDFKLKKALQKAR